MISQKLETELSSFAEHLAHESSKVILPHFRSRMTTQDKAEAISDKEFDPVTIADRNAEQRMRELINNRFPDHGIVGEEFGNENPDAEFVWILDPIDGTKSFITGFLGWGTLIGLTYKKEPLLGVMSQPFTGEVFIGSSNQTTFTRNDEPIQHLKSRDCKTLSEAILTTTSPNLFANSDDRDRYFSVEKQVKLSRYGGDCYSYCMLASGHIDLVIESGLQPYDIAALIPIVKSSGGKITSWTGGNPLTDGSALAAGSIEVHQQALELLNK